MPRNVAGVMSRPIGTTAVPGQTIQSSTFETTIDDLVDDANNARPVVAGGTGAVNAQQARANLGLRIGEDVLSAGDITPSGAIMSFAGIAAPAGWLLCGGQAVDRTAFANLFAVIGETYGAGDGTNTFNLPDLRGRVVAGLDNLGGIPASRLTDANGLDGTTIGATGGTQTQALTTAQLPATTVTPDGAVDVNFQGRFPANTTNGGGPAGNGIFGVSATDAISIDFTGSSASFTGEPLTFGGNEAHNNVQPTMALAYIIKT